MITYFSIQSLRGALAWSLLNDAMAEDDFVGQFVALAYLVQHGWL